VLVEDLAWHDGPAPEAAALPLEPATEVEQIVLLTSWHCL